MNVEELVREMEQIEGWRLVDGCISVEGPRTAPGSCMCPIVAVHWSGRDGGCGSPNRGWIWGWA